MITSAILVHPNFDHVWPFTADHAHQLWREQGEVEFIRTNPGEKRPVGELLADPSQIKRLVAFDVPFTLSCIERLPQLREVVIQCGGYGSLPEGDPIFRELQAKGVRVIRKTSEGFWGQSVSEFGLALTLAALRRIPQTHRSIIESHQEWDYSPPGGVGTPGARGGQFGDNPKFTCGTLEGKRVRIVGAGNIASRYASFASFMGADVAAWDPFATEPCFHRAGGRREHFLDRLVQDAEIFVPMVPLTEKTACLVTAKHIQALPNGALVILVTRAGVVDVPALRQRVLADELALAADVFDTEPLPLDDPLLGRHNVIHTPHNAGRTRQANERLAEMFLEQFEPLLRG